VAALERRLRAPPSGGARPPGTSVSVGQGAAPGVR
jgi:hypothetical protein